MEGSAFIGEKAESSSGIAVDGGRDYLGRIGQRETLQLAKMQPSVADIVHVPNMSSSNQLHSSSTTSCQSAALSGTAVFRSMRLAQSRARMAEDSLRRIETACRDTWREVFVQETEKADELRGVEAAYLSYTEDGKDGSHKEGAMKGHPRSEETDQAQPQLPKKPRQRGRFLLAISPLPLHSRVSEAGQLGTGSQSIRINEVPHEKTGDLSPAKDLSTLRHTEIVRMQREILRLRQDVGAAHLARRTLEARLGGCVVFQSDVSHFLVEGTGDILGALRTGSGPGDRIGAQLDEARGIGERSVQKEEFGLDEGRLRQEVADLRQQTAVANRLALEAMGGEEAADAALQGVMERCQWELQQSAGKLSDCQRSCEALRRSAQQLQRRLDRKGVAGGGGEEGKPHFSVESWLTNLLKSVGQAHFWVAARGLVQKGFVRAWDFLRKHFLLPTKQLTAGLADDVGLQKSASCEELECRNGRKREGDGLYKSSLSPSPSVEWEMGPSEDEFGGEWGEGMWTERMDIPPNLRRKPGREGEEPWHMVFLIYVVFTWQEVADMGL